jgi:hypothetical protein
MTPPYESLLLVAEQCPDNMAVLLQIWKHCYDERVESMEFECSDADNPDDWQDLLDTLEELEAWSQLTYEFIGHSEIEVFIPVRNGVKLPYLDN